MIAELEPAVHPFRPIRIEMPRGRVSPVPDYGLVIGDSRESFVPVDKYPRPWERSGRFGHGRVWSRGETYCTRQSFSRPAIGGAHPWQKRKLSDQNVVICDELQAEIADLGLRMPRIYRVKEV